ncbi:MAG: hypothetical protein QXK24_00150 [Ignisphaera sp.]
MNEDTLEIIQRLTRVETKLDIICETLKEFKKAYQEDREEIDCEISLLKNKIEGKEAAKLTLLTKIIIFILSFIGGLISQIVGRLIG